MSYHNILSLAGIFGAKGCCQEEILFFHNLPNHFNVIVKFKPWSNEDESWWELAVMGCCLAAVLDAFSTQSCILLKWKHSQNTYSFIFSLWSLKCPLWQFVTANSHQLSSSFDSAFKHNMYPILFAIDYLFQKSTYGCEVSTMMVDNITARNSISFILSRC